MSVHSLQELCGITISSTFLSTIPHHLHDFVHYGFDTKMVKNKQQQELRYLAIIRALRICCRISNDAYDDFGHYNYTCFQDCKKKIKDCLYKISPFNPNAISIESFRRRIINDLEAEFQFHDIFFYALSDIDSLYSVACCGKCGKINHNIVYCSTCKTYYCNSCLLHQVISHGFCPKCNKKIYH